MAQVPTYKPTVAERPALQVNITTRASADDFGAATGRGMQALGQGVAQAADQFAQLRDLEDQMRAKEADNLFAAWNREAQYGEGGYMTLQGQAAVDGKTAYETQLEERRREFGADLQGGAAQMYSNASRSRVNSALDSSIVHQANERKSWFNDTANARLDTFAEDALAVWNNPAKVDFNIAGGQAELRQQGTMLGWSADVLANKEAQYISDVRKNIALRTMADDPIKAQSYIEEHRGQLTGQAQFELDEALQVPLINAQGLQAAGAFFETGGRTYSVDNQGQGPTNARAYLMDKSVNPRQAHIDGLDGAFTNNLAALMQDAPFEGLGVLSGNRTQEEQVALFEGSDKTGKMVAFPIGYKKPDGSISNGSNHQHGAAVDISYNGRSLKHAPKEVIDWVHSNAGKYGINFPMSWEPWHAETTGARGAAVSATGVTVPRANMPSRMDMEAYLGTIADPKARSVARSAIVAQMESASKDAEAQRKQIGQQAFSEMVTQNVSPFSFAPEVQAALGVETMNTLTSYWEKSAAGETVQTNPVAMVELGKLYSTDPKAFSRLNPTDYVNDLSKADLNTVMDWQRNALTEQRKSAEQGLDLGKAFSASSEQLNAAGFLTGGGVDAQKPENARAIAEFQYRLMQEMQSFKEANERPPNETDIQDLTRKLLLPIVTKPATQDDGWLGNHFFGVGLQSPQNGRLFQSGSLLQDGVAYDINVQYADVPVEMRTTIRDRLTQELRHAPTEQEIADEYELVVMNEQQNIDYQAVAQSYRGQMAMPSDAAMRSSYLDIIKGR